MSSTVSISRPTVAISNLQARPPDGAHDHTGWLASFDVSLRTRNELCASALCSGVYARPELVLLVLYASRDLDGHDQLRAGHGAGEAVQRRGSQERALPPALRQDRRARRAEARRSLERRGGRLRRHRQGLRARARPLRGGRARRARRARAEKDQDDRDRGVRRRSHRSTPSTTTTRTTSRRAPAARSPTGCCSRRCARPAKWRSRAS